jgi:hypothetical protein
MPLGRSAVRRETVSESPIGVLTLSLIPTPGPRSVPRIPGQQGGEEQLVPSIVPSTKVDWSAEPTKSPNRGSGVPVVTSRRKSSYKSPRLMGRQLTLSSANGGKHTRLNRTCTESARDASASSSPSWIQARFPPACTEFDGDVFRQSDQDPVRWYRYSANCTKPEPLGRSRYSVQSARTAAVPDGIGNVQETIELFVPGIKLRVPGSPPKKKRSLARSFWGLHASLVGMEVPDRSVHREPVPKGTRAETMGAPAVPRMTSPRKASVPPAGA